MSAGAVTGSGVNADATPPCALVWIDAREAVIVRWRDGRSRLEWMESHIPPHHRATGHIRHDPAIRHGGGGPQDAGERHRQEYLKRFLADVSARLVTGGDLLILGPGAIRQRLARDVAQQDLHCGRHRQVASEASPPLTDRQLTARLRTFAGEDLPRMAGARH